jgi:hypothetical protein
MTEPPRKKVKRSNDWSECEDALLLALKEFHKNYTGWDWARYYLPQRSAGACMWRWNKLIKKTENQMVQESGMELITVPEGMSQIPWLAFKVICSHLPPKTVFGVLPLVCTQFNQNIKMNKVPVSNIELVYDPAKYTTPIIQIVMFKKRVLSCKTLRLTCVPTSNLSFWFFCYYKLVARVGDSIDEVVMLP